MSAVRHRDTAPEIAVRQFVHRFGYRYRLHRRDLPGKPDLSFSARKKAIEVRGCFWHGHPGCPHASVPTTRREWWATKLAGNAARDARNEAALRAMGWDLLVVWECEVDHDSVRYRIQDFLGKPARRIERRPGCFYHRRATVPT